MTTKRKGGDVSAIFVHAGAGFHSHQNETVHLEACAKAATAAMAFLNNGSTAVEAVEAAVRVLEDNEITNAGYGSNLAIDGTVECDATIVDHYGRSGAVGAMGQVAHPIHVAKLILEGSTQRLSLRRVPPNFLVGQGAIDYAFDHDVPIMHPDYLVSRNAKERWRRWTKDLTQAHGKAHKVTDSDTAAVMGAKTRLANGAEIPGTPNTDKRLAPLVNESQPYSPTLSPGYDETASSSRNTSSQGLDLLKQSKSLQGLHMSCSTGLCKAGLYDTCPTNLKSTSDSGLKQKSDPQDGSTEYLVFEVGDSMNYVDPDPAVCSTSAHDWDHSVPTQPPSLHSTSDKSPDEFSLDSLNERGTQHSPDNSWPTSPDSPIIDPTSEDHITDTVGAIAIDSFGNIAAASSSGGIGMKHRGRTGPAALVGIGTAVHPAHSRDKSKKSVAVVTSGTGEHMATTMAAGTCASRLYWGTRTSSGGDTVPTDDETAIQSFVTDDFMGHPSVKHSNTSAAIGVMAVIKTIDGVWFNFAHNTDSFALCSMTSEDKEPVVVMSRLGNKTSELTSGGRSCGWRPNRSDNPESKRLKKTLNNFKKKDDKRTINSSPIAVSTKKDSFGSAEHQT